MKPLTIFVSIALFGLLISSCHKESILPQPKTPDEIIEEAFADSEIVKVTETITLKIQNPQLSSTCFHGLCSVKIKKYVEYFQPIANQNCEPVFVGLECCDENGYEYSIDLMIMPEKKKCKTLQVPVHVMANDNSGYF